MSIGPLIPLKVMFQLKIYFIRRHDAPYSLNFSVWSVRKWAIEAMDHAEESCSFCLCVVDILLLEEVTAELVTGLFEPESLLAQK